MEQATITKIVNWTFLVLVWIWMILFAVLMRMPSSTFLQFFAFLFLMLFLVSGIVVCQNMFAQYLRIAGGEKIGQIPGGPFLLFVIHAGTIFAFALMIGSFTKLDVPSLIIYSSGIYFAALILGMLHKDIITLIVGLIFGESLLSYVQFRTIEVPIQDFLHLPTWIVLGFAACALTLLTALILPHLRGPLQKVFSRIYLIKE